MDVKLYFETINEFIDDLSDEDFDSLLLRAGIEDCPYDECEDEFVRTTTLVSYKTQIKSTQSRVIGSLKDMNIFKMGDVA